MFDLRLSNQEVQNNLPGRTNSGRVNVVRPTLAGARYLPCALCLEDIIENDTGRVMLAGIVDHAILQEAALQVGDRFVASGANANLHRASLSGERVIALVMETGTTTPSQVWFDGVNATWGIYFAG